MVTSKAPKGIMSWKAELQKAFNARASRLINTEETTTMTSRIVFTLRLPSKTPSISVIGDLTKDEVFIPAESQISETRWIDIFAENEEKEELKVDASEN